MQHSTHRQPAIQIVLLLLVVSGCGSGGGGAEPVSGTLTLDGKPVPGAYLTLVANDKSLGGPYTGKTDEQGQFAMGPLGDAGAGVPAGVYELTITTAHSDDAGSETAVMPQELIPAKARVQTLEVPQGGLPDFNLQLSSQ